MGKFLDYNPDQAYLLPPSVRDVLGSGHLCFFVRQDGGQVEPERLPRRVRKRRRTGVRAGDDGFGLAVRLRAGGDQFAKVGTAHSGGFGVSLFGGRGGAGSLDAERVSAAAREGVERFVYAGGGVGAGQRAGTIGTRGHRLDAHCGERIAQSPGHRASVARETGAHSARHSAMAEAVRRGGSRTKARACEVGSEAIERLERQGQEIPARLERLRKSGLKKLSRTDADSRFLRERGGFTLGYTGTLAVSEDHLIVGQCVTQETNDNGLLLPLVDLVEQTCGEKPRCASADSGFFSVENLRALEERGIDGYVPDSHLARWLNRGGRLRTRANDPALSPHATEIARPGRPRDVRQTQSHRRTGERSVERAARHEAVPPTRAGPGERRMGAEQHRV